MDADLAEGLMSWLSRAMDHLKEWVGVGAAGRLMVLVLVLCLWCICRLRVLQGRDAARLVQAFTALEAGQSLQVWLATLKVK